LIVALHAANPGPFTGAGNWTYLVTGRPPVLVDAGVGKPEHLDAIAERLPGGPGRVVVTHAHDDHASGAAAIAARWPQTRFFKLPWPGRDELYPVPWIPLADGDVIEAGEDSLQVVHTPGHAPDHICLWHAATRALISGDLVVKGSSVVIPASASGSLAAYLQSLERIDCLDAARLLPAHGEVIDDPRAIIRAYHEHRKARERQVLDALDAGLTTIAAMTDRIYPDLKPELTRMARESVLAHLEKLRDEAVVDRAGDSWHLRARSRG
jgi:glyoxylase-like metal-dependent hydrolase (beta-lactamase superfamily II)